MRSRSTFLEETQNIGSIPGVLWTGEQAALEKPPTWPVQEYGFDRIPGDRETDVPGTDNKPWVPVAPTSEPSMFGDDVFIIPGFDGRVIPVETSWLSQSRWDEPDESVTSFLGLDVTGAIEAVGADGSQVRSRVAAATAKRGTDAFGTYLPWHRYANSPKTPWGVWFFLEPLLWWAADLRAVGARAGLVLDARQAFNLAFCATYRHELFHFHVERFAIRQEVLLRKPIYLPYDREVFSHPQIVGTEHWLEEALAQTTVLESGWLYKRVGLAKNGLRAFLAEQFRRFGGGYGDFECKSKGGPERAHGLLAAQIIRRTRFPRIPVTKLATPKQERSAAPGLVPGYLAFTPQIVDRFQLPMQEH